MVFMDHFKGFYVRDLQKLEKGGFLHNGSVVFADNITKNIAPSLEFSEYVRNSGHYDCQFYEVDMEYVQGREDGMERAIFKGADMFSGETLGL